MIKRQIVDQRQLLAEKLCDYSEATQRTGRGERVNKSKANGRHHDELDRNVIYDTSLQIKMCLNLYVVSDQLHTLSDPRKLTHFSMHLPRNCSAIKNADSK